MWDDPKDKMSNRFSWTRFDTNDSAFPASALELPARYRNNCKQIPGSQIKIPADKIPADTTRPVKMDR